LLRSSQDARPPDVTASDDRSVLPGSPTFLLVAAGAVLAACAAPNPKRKVRIVTQVKAILRSSSARRSLAARKLFREPKGADDDGAFPGFGGAISPEIMSGSVAYSIETQSVNAAKALADVVLGLAKRKYRACQGASGGRWGHDQCYCRRSGHA